jgi:outer membrane protein assembly factor BamB
MTDTKATCIDPGTGKTIWTSDQVPMSSAAVPAIKGDTIVSIGDGRKGRGSKVGLTCCRLSLKGVEKLWSLPASEWNNGRCCPVIYNGHAYCYVRCGTSDPRYWLCVDMESGQIVAKVEGAPKLWCGLVAGDGLLFHGACLLKADPSGFKRLPDRKNFAGGVGFGGGPSCVTSAFVDGKLYVRGRYSLYCYDMVK